MRFTHPGGNRPLQQVENGTDADGLIESYHLNAAVKREKYGNVDGLFSRLFTVDLYRNIKTEVYQYLFAKYKSTKPPITYLIIWLLNVLLLIGTIVAVAVLPFSGTCFLAILGLSFLRGLIIRDLHGASHYAWIGYGPLLNTIIYEVSMIFSGTTAIEWTPKHVDKHHLYTALENLDNDAIYPIARVSQKQAYRWWHKYQCYYLPFFYSFLVFFWTIGNILTPVYCTSKTLIRHYVGIFCPVLFYCILPYYTDGGAIKVFLIALFTSLFLAPRFIVNHDVLPCQEYADGVNKFPVEWAEHQLRTSTEYATDSWIENQLSGGLNHQAIHHLFPGIHFSFYPEIAPIVYRIAAEKQIHIAVFPTMFEALKSHFKLLSNLSTP